MKIQEKHTFHGAALAQIVEHPSFKALNTASSHYGHYRVNTDKQVFVKYRTGDGSPWQFVFSSDEMRKLRRAHQSEDDTYLCLVCGSTTVCALNQEETDTVLDMAKNNTQSITVEVPQGCSCRVRGSGGQLRGTVPHNSFPNKVFA